MNKIPLNVLTSSASTPANVKLATEFGALPTARSAADGKSTDLIIYQKPEILVTSSAASDINNNITNEKKRSFLEAKSRIRQNNTNISINSNGGGLNEAAYLNSIGALTSQQQQQQQVRDSSSMEGVRPTMPWTDASMWNMPMLQQQQVPQIQTYDPDAMVLDDL